MWETRGQEPVGRSEVQAVGAPSRWDALEGTEPVSGCPCFGGWRALTVPSLRWSVVGAGPCARVRTPRGGSVPCAHVLALLRVQLSTSPSIRWKS